MKESIRRYVAETYPEQYACLIAGKLIDDWQNVADHCIMQAVAMECLADVLHLPVEAKKRLVEVAVCHDWEKRLSKKKCQDFDHAEFIHAKETFRNAKVDLDLMGACSPEFLLSFHDGDATLLAMIQFFIDDMCMGEKIVHFNERIDEVSARNPHPDDEIEKELGRPYWEVEREICNAIDCMLRSFLRPKGFIGISVDTLINDKIIERFPE